MKATLNLETLKFIGGAIIVAVAALIMFPGFLSLASGLLRIAIIIVVAGGTCLALAYATRRVLKSKRSSIKPAAIEASDRVDGNPT